MFAVHELIAKKIDALQADVRRAEVVILQAKEERHQAEMALRQKHGPGVCMFTQLSNG